MAAELVKIIRQNAGVDRILRKNIQAKIRVNVKRLLKKYGYPPEKQKLATENILKQAELLCIGAEQFTSNCIMKGSTLIFPGPDCELIIGTK